MQSAQALEEESKTEKEKGIKYRGTACIKLNWLHFQWNGYQLECLHGQHRIQVAQQVLSPLNRW